MISTSIAKDRMGVFLYAIKSPESKRQYPRRFKMFVETLYQKYWQCKRMFELVQIYEEDEYDLHELLRLHRIIKRLGMKEQGIMKVFELVKENQLELLQRK